MASSETRRSEERRKGSFHGTLNSDGTVGGQWYIQSMAKSEGGVYLCLV